MLGNNVGAISRFFKEARENANLTQEEVAKSLGYTSKQIVSNWERGVCTPPLNQIAQLVKLLNLNPETVVELFLDASRAHFEEIFYDRTKKPRRRSTHS